MTELTRVSSQSPTERFRWVCADSWTITRRDLGHWMAQPVQLITGFLFPIMMVLMFGFLFAGGMSVPGGGSYREFLMPGMFAMTMLFGAESTFTAVSTDANRGITDRFRSLPMAGSAVVIGRSLADMLHSVLTLVVMIGCGFAIGWGWHSSFGQAIFAFVLLLLLRFALLWIGIYLGLLLRSPEAVMAFQILVWPLGFLSSAFVSPATMPSWLGVIAEWNPLSATASAVRELFDNPGWGGGSWIAQHSVLMSIVWPIVLTAIFSTLSVRRYQRLSI